MAQREDFWSRRRAAVEAEQMAEQAAVEQAVTAQADAELEARSDEDILAELDLPQPEDLDTTEAVQAFMKSAVPQRLKTRALRRLWRLNPIFGALDGLVDYGEDFTDSATVIENMQTVYQVGKGMFDKVEEMARAKEAAEAKAEAKAEAAERDAEPDLETEADAQDTAPSQPALAQDPVDVEMTPALVEHEDIEPVPSAPRRMRFSFDANNIGSHT